MNWSDEKKRDDYGPPWEECTEGGFAVCRQTADDQEGIYVYKIQDKHVLASGQSETYATFSGTEYICTKKNSDIECIRKGKWYFHTSLSKSDVVFNWCVIGYFDSLDAGGRLPGNIIHLIHTEHSIQYLVYQNNSYLVIITLFDFAFYFYNLMFIKPSFYVSLKQIPILITSKHLIWTLFSESFHGKTFEKLFQSLPRMRFYNHIQ